MPDRMLGDAPRPCQILQNLVGNALKFTTRGRVDFRITGAGVAADDGATAIRFEIDYTGIGMRRNNWHGSSTPSLKQTTASRAAAATAASACQSRNAWPH